MTENNRPLLITSSLPLIDEVIRLASTSALEVHVAGEMDSASDRWLTAPLVLVGSDVHFGDPPSRRARVLVVHSEDTRVDGAGSLDTRVQRDMWRFAVELGARRLLTLQSAEQKVEHLKCTDLAQWVVAIPTLRGLNAVRASAGASTAGDRFVSCPQPLPGNP